MVFTMSKLRALLIILSGLTFIRKSLCIQSEAELTYQTVPPEDTIYIPISHTNFVHPLPPQIRPAFSHKPKEVSELRKLPERGDQIKQRSINEEHHQETNSSMNVNDLLLALGLNEEEPHELSAQSNVATGREYNLPSHLPYPQAPPDYGYPPQEYWNPNAYPGNTYGSIPPSYPHQSVQPTKPLPILKDAPPKLPDLRSLVKPVASKVASKFSGLIGFVLSLLGSSGDGLELKGLKDIVINGIVKPLLLAKGGLKALISKLAIPVIALLLINVEILVVMWWLWEDCSSEPVHSTPAVYPYSYQKPGPTYGYR